MVVDDGNFDIMDIEDIILDDIDKRPSFHEFPESQLCVPPDPIEDLEWFPSFSDDFISLSGVGLMPEHEISSNFFASAKPSHYQPPDKLTVCNFPVTPEQLDHGKTKPLPKTVKRQNGSGMEKVRVEISEAEFAGFINKKARTRKRGNKLEDQKRKRGLAEKWVRKRCSHCQTEETPQWRVGPLGPKTLCNACGVRFKSGRLVPEYRPASSPTFDGFRHSNYHRKILKMRGLVNYDDY